MLRVVVALFVTSSVLAAGAPSSAATGRESTTTTVMVVMKDFKFILSRKSVPVGTVVFKIVNKGSVRHNMVFQAPLFKGSPLISRGGRYTLKVTLKRPRTYVFICTPHFELGMIGQIRATKT
jgi:plastocyanin